MADSGFFFAPQKLHGIFAICSAFQTCVCICPCACMWVYACRCASVASLERVETTGALTLFPHINLIRILSRRDPALNSFYPNHSGSCD